MNLFGTDEIQIKTFPIIYKRGQDGKSIQQWKMEINPDNPGQVRSVSGKVNGKLVESKWKQCKHKNPGKKNERTPAQQAVAEIEAAYRKSLERDYHSDINNIDNSNYFKPMLCKGYDEHWGKFSDFKQKVYHNPKLDGMRCIIDKNGMWSREGKSIVSCPHILNELKDIFVEYPNLKLDGELYNHDYKDNFDELMSIFKKLKPAEDDLIKSEKLGQFHVYDCPCELPFSERYDALKKTLKEFKPKYCCLVEAIEITSQEQLDSLYDAVQEDGYEGQIIRIDGKNYFNGNTDHLLKRKPFVTSEFKLKSFEEGQGNWAGLVKRAIFELDDESGREFGAGVKGDMEYCKYLMDNKDSFVGTYCTVEYAKQRTPDGIPRFGVVKEFDRQDFTPGNN